MSRLPRTSQIELPRWSSPWSSLFISVARMRAGPTNRPDPCLFWPASWPVNCFLQIYTKSPAEKSKTCRCRELVALEIRCWHCQSIRAFSAVAILSQFSCCMALGSKHVSSGQDGSTVEKNLPATSGVLPMTCCSGEWPLMLSLELRMRMLSDKASGAETSGWSVTIFSSKYLIDSMLLSHEFSFQCASPGIMSKNISCQSQNSEISWLRKAPSGSNRRVCGVPK